MAQIEAKLSEWGVDGDFESKMRALAAFINVEKKLVESSDANACSNEPKNLSSLLSDFGRASTTTRSDNKPGAF